MHQQNKTGSQHSAKWGQFLSPYRLSRLYSLRKITAPGPHVVHPSIHPSRFNRSSDINNSSIYDDDDRLDHEGDEGDSDEDDDVDEF